MTYRAIGDRKESFVDGRSFLRGFFSGRGFWRRLLDNSCERAGWSAAFRLPRELEEMTAISGLVDIPKETRGDSRLSFGRVSIMGAISEGGWSCEICSISGVGLGLESQDARVFDMERGAVGVVNLAGVRGASAVAKIVSKFLRKDE